MLALFDPPMAVTTTLADPATPAGVVAVIEVGLTVVTLVAAVPPIVTPVTLTKLLPPMVTDCPPARAPRAGVIELAAGTPTYW